ncbi:uncharacterized protein LOC121999179 [Zingiber officinale]|uniref:uncharacterized protein LOC121999179 n=1 Tax=Zingiber officinale TaxID=94328 RepID=UPI001C4DD27A|nr:uncharacterized protein LOC121999179 [Zingiber officinale]
MGNGASCVPRCIQAAATAKVVGPDGVLHPIEAPAGAAEIMMEFPGHAVARADEALRTRRAAGLLRADEELLPGAVYLLLPLNRVGSRLSDCQVEVLLEAVGRRRRRCKEDCRGRRVFPEISGGSEENTSKRVGGCRQWRPSLDTIHESKSR